MLTLVVSSKVLLAHIVPYVYSTFDLILIPQCVPVAVLLLVKVYHVTEDR